MQGKRRGTMAWLCCVTACGWAGFILATRPVWAEPLPREQVPEPLEPWIDWVLRDVPEAACPYVLSGERAARKQCVWVSSLVLDLKEQGARFQERVQASRDSWIPLPGGLAHWPEAVQLDGEPAAVVQRPAGPSIRVSAGGHRILGQLEFPRMPESLAIPALTGITLLRVRGADLPSATRIEPGLLWLGREEVTPAEEDALDVTVHRKLTDGVPARLETILSLGVSGRSREIVFDQPLPEGFVPLALESPLPARIDAAGTLRIQARAGRFDVRLFARDDRREISAAYPATARAWDPTEVWSFQDAPELRWVEVEGVPPVDPGQTEVPRPWRELPAYLLERGATLELSERRRTGSDPVADRLELERTLWLDFDGGGYTLHDQVTGELGRSDRLEMTPAISLGRVAVEGRDLPITRLEEDGPAGVELRNDPLDLEADARLERSPSARNARSTSGVPAVGWNGDFVAASAELRLPPGWTALHVIGPDSVSGGWIDHWSLLEIFLVLITALACAQLFGVVWGAAALIGLVLIFPEAGAPRYIWLVALGLFALTDVVPAGRLRGAILIARVFTAIALAWIAVPFAVQQARQALHPALERSGAPVSMASSSDTQPTKLERLRDSAASPARTPKTDRPMAPPSEEPADDKLARLERTDLTAAISTGGGLPTWSWRSVKLGWTGPVTPGEAFSPLLIPPFANRLLAALRVAALALLAAITGMGVARLRQLTRWGGRWGGGGRPGSSGAATLSVLLAALGLGASLALVPGSAAADFPSQAQLDQLRERLIEPPDCLPECASVPRLQLEIEPAQLRARLEIDVATQGGVPLPGMLGGFTPQQVSIGSGGTPPLARTQDGVLIAKLDPGHHQVLLIGPLPDVESLELPLPLPPRQIEVSSRGWQVSGIRPGDRATRSLKLVRSQAQPAGAGSEEGGSAPPPGPPGIPGFVRVTRSLTLGLTWRVVTRIERLSPLGPALSVSLPLIDGEAVTGSEVEVKDRKARVSLAPQVRTLQWRSTLEPRRTIALQAPSEGPWVETWNVQVSPLWHLEAAGIPPAGTKRTRTQTWQPWPGEQVALTLTRPKSVGGQSITLDASELEVSPGARAADTKLTLLLRTSRADRHEITLPRGAALTDVRIDGQRKPLRPVDQALELPLRPGAQQIEVEWRTPGTKGLVYETPRIDLGMPSVNATTRIEVPRDRWILLSGGPRLGPAVLFWGSLAVAALLAFALGRVPLTPLSSGAWLLLFVGLTQTGVVPASLIVVWLLALGLRRRFPPRGRFLFDATQVGLSLLSFGALSILIGAIGTGLLGSPEMQIQGNGSTGSQLVWYQDRSDPVPASSWVFWVPLWVYRLAMLAWALWIARSLLRWLGWGWECFSHEGLWRPLRASRISTPGSPQ